MYPGRGRRRSDSGMIGCPARNPPAVTELTPATGNGNDL